MSKKENKEEENLFDLQKALEDVNPYLREGLEKYIYYNNVKVTNQKEFDKTLKIYGGF